MKGPIAYAHARIRACRSRLLTRMDMRRTTPPRPACATSTRPTATSSIASTQSPSASACHSRRREARERLTVARDASADAERVRAAAPELERVAALRFAVVCLGIAAPEALAAISAMLAPTPHAVIVLECGGKASAFESARESESGGGASALQILFAAAVPAHARQRLDEAMCLTSARAVTTKWTGDVAGDERDDAVRRNVAITE